MGDWHALGKKNYRKWNIYTEMLWNKTPLIDINHFSDYKIIGSQFGGPLILIKESNKNRQIITTTSSGLFLGEVIFIISLSQLINAHNNLF